MIDSFRRCQVRFRGEANNSRPNGVSSANTTPVSGLNLVATVWGALVVIETVTAPEEEIGSGKIVQPASCGSPEHAL
jgi:hypothetical protein